MNILWVCLIVAWTYFVYRTQTHLHRQVRSRVALVQRLDKLEAAVNWWAQEHPEIGTPDELIAAHQAHLTKCYMHGLVKTPETK